jgi:glycosyltransferase involved in cell wall biosynthesis
MRIIFVSPIFQQRNSGHRQSGGEISNRVLVEGLSERHDVSVLALLGSQLERDREIRGQQPYSYQWLYPPGAQSFLKRTIAVKRLMSQLRSRVAYLQPDIIVSATSTLGMALAVGASSNTPVVALVRAFEHAEETPTVFSRLRKIAKRIQWGDYSATRFVECSMVVYNSDFLARWYMKRVGMHRSSVVYPPLDVAGDGETWNGATERVLMVGTSQPKGIDITLDAARMDPRRTYFIAGGDPGYWSHRASANVKFLGWQDDRASLYASVDVVMVPSRCEPFGRVAVEALRFGRAVIVSASGGLPEAIGHAQPLIVDSLDPAVWLERLNWLETNVDDAVKAVTEAHSKTTRFNPEVQLDKFASMLDSVVYGAPMSPTDCATNQITPR